MKFILTTVALLGIALPATAASVTGNTMIAACEHYVANDDRYGDTMLQGECVGLALGILYEGPAVHICTPKGVNMGQAVRVMTRFMNDHSAELNDLAANLAEDAFKQAWPCP